MSLDENLKARCDQLFSMGLAFNFDNAYVGSGILSDVNVPLLDIRLDDDVKWERNMRRLQKEIDRRKALPPLDIITGHNRGGPADRVTG